MISIIIPKKSYFKKAYQLLLDGEVQLRNKKYDYYHLNEKIYDADDFQNLLKTNNINSVIKMSSGTSDRKAFKGFLKQSSLDLRNNTYYRSYSSPKGNKTARKALAFMESLKLTGDQSFILEDICLTTGSTGAITIVFEYLKNECPNAEVLIATPSYYLYKFAAKYWGLSFKEVFPKKRQSLKCVEELISNVSNKTKLVVITQPTNPSGEVYTSQELKKLLSVAKKKDILVLIDELFFDLIFNPKNYLGITTIASSLNGLENIVVIRGYSKNKNLVAFRLGYLISKNKELMNFAEKSSEVRQCFPVASNNTGLIGLDAFIQSVDYLMSISKNNSLVKIVNQIKNNLEFVESVSSKSVKELFLIYKEYKKYSQKILDFYSKNFDIAQKLLQNVVEISMPKQAAFNTFVKIKGLENINYFDFCFNFYLTCGVETQIGPCYAFKQKMWEQDKKLGFWLRITFARDRKQFIQGLKKFIEFKKVYLNNQDKFLKTNVYAV